MDITSPILDQWPLLRSALPGGFDLEATARACGAFRRARGVKNVETLLRLALGYGACGMSLRECCAWAEARGLASLSDPALLKRLCKAADWLGDLTGALLADRTRLSGRRLAGYRVRAVDATTICAPGADRTTWRLHVGYDLASGQADRIELSDGRGPESLTRFTHRPGDIVLADRGYARARDLRCVVAAGADFIVRTGWNALRLKKPDGEAFDLFAMLPGRGARERETMVVVDEGQSIADRSVHDKPLLLRLVMRRKSDAEAQAARHRLLKEARKRGKQPDPRSLEAAKYILLLTSLPRETFAAADVLELYRMRWQIELAFKRFKSLAGLDELPAKDPDLARAWIYARLIAILIADGIAGKLPDSPPCAPEKSGGKSIAMAKPQTGARQRPRRDQGAAVMAMDTQRLQVAQTFLV